jgi:hypothetical protein
LLSGFPVLLTSPTAHARTMPCILVLQTVNMFESAVPTTRLTEFTKFAENEYFMAPERTKRLSALLLRRSSTKVSLSELMILWQLEAATVSRSYANETRRPIHFWRRFCRSMRGTPAGIKVDRSRNIAAASSRTILGRTWGMISASVLPLLGHHIRGKQATRSPGNLQATRRSNNSLLPANPQAFPRPEDQTEAARRADRILPQGQG